MAVREPSLALLFYETIEEAVPAAVPEPESSQLLLLLHFTSVTVYRGATLFTDWTIIPLPLGTLTPGAADWRCQTEDHFLGMG